MSGQKEEAQKAVNIAKKRWAAGKREKAIKMLEKALRMHEMADIKSLLQDWKTAPQSAAGKPAPAAASSAPSPSSTSEPSQTSEPRRVVKDDQREAVDHVMMTDNYYELLDVPKGAIDEKVLKKAYRKLAIKLHPDKNPHSKAEDAFKKLARAYQCLNDPQKKEIYDQYGTESPEMQQRFRHQEMSPEELFSMFFGGGFGNVHMQHHRRGPQFQQRRQAQHGQANAEEAGGYTRLLQMAPFVLMMIFSLFGQMGMGDNQPFRLDKGSGYNLKRQTGHGIAYYVDRDFDRYYRYKVKAVEDLVESSWFTQTKQKCWDERRTRDAGIRRAKLSKNDSGKATRLSKAHAVRLEQCDALEEFTDAFSRLDQ